MPALTPALEKSFRRSRIRFQVLLVLRELGRAYPAQIARRIGVAQPRVVAALLGHGDDYKVEFSLVGLRMVHGFPAAEGDVFELTREGALQAEVAFELLDRRVSIGADDRAIVLARVTAHPFRDSASSGTGDASPASAAPPPPPAPPASPASPASPPPSATSAVSSSSSPAPAHFAFSIVTYAL